MPLCMPLFPELSFCLVNHFKLTQTAQAMSSDSRSTHTHEDKLYFNHQLYFFFFFFYSGQFLHYPKAYSQSSENIV